MEALRAHGGRKPGRALPLVSVCVVVLSLSCLTATATAASQGDVIVREAAKWAGTPYCWDGGNQFGPTPGTRDPENGLQCGVGGYGPPGMVGFDCTGLTLYAVYQATGILLPHGVGQNSAPGGTPVARSELQPGDLVFFGPSLAHYTHAGVYAGGGKMWDAQTEHVPVALHSLYSNYVGATRYWHEKKEEEPPPPPPKHVPFDVNGDGKSDVCFFTGVNGGTTGTGDLEAHCALGGDFQARADFATPFGYIDTRTAMPYLADVNGDGKADMCFLTGVNGGVTGSGAVEVHCALGGDFQSRVDFPTTFGYADTRTAMPFFADINGDGKSDMCLLTGLNGGSTGSGAVEVHCALGGDFQSRVDFATTFGYADTRTAMPFFADVNGDGKSDMCLVTGVNGGTTGSGHVEVHCALGGDFQSRVDFATSFGYLDTRTAMPFFADVNGDGKADLCLLTGLNGGTTGSGNLEVHCALGGDFQSRIDVATSFGYLTTQTAMPFFADVNGDGKSDMCFLTGLNGGMTGSGALEVHCALGGDFQSRVDVPTPFGYVNTETAWVANLGLSVPLAPGPPAAAGGDRSASVSFAPPPFEGGNPIISYTVTSSPGGISATGSSSPITVSGLANGTGYTFTVTASNALGPSVQSPPSNSVTPAGALQLPPPTPMSTTKPSPTAAPARGVLASSSLGAGTAAAALARAVAECRKIRPQHRRARCVAVARHRYGTSIAKAAYLMCFGEHGPIARVHPSRCDVFGEPEDDADLIRISAAHWRDWGSSVAHATATALPNKPAEERPVSVVITLSGLSRRCHGQLFYTRLVAVKTSGTSSWFNPSGRRTLPLSGACHEILVRG
jgi:hypothetical protein